MDVQREGFWGCLILGGFWFVLDVMREDRRGLLKGCVYLYVDICIRSIYMNG